MRTKHTIAIDISDDAAGTDILFSQDAKLALTQTDVWQRCNSGKQQIAASGTENVPFGDVGDVRFVYLKADGDFNLSFNSGVEILNVKRASATGTAKFCAEIDVTQVAVTNPSSSVVLNLVYAVAGDPA